MLSARCYVIAEYACYGDYAYIVSVGNDVHCLLVCVRVLFR